MGRFPLFRNPRTQKTVHPHACGEIHSRLEPCHARPGTSPRLWGDFLLPSVALYPFRYIPTLVGRFYITPQNTFHPLVHPHACGEIACHHRTIERIIGTSPRLWGDFSILNISDSLTRYIPTLVGRLASPMTCVIASPVHPHACGEIFPGRPGGRFVFGTSPRLWGDSPRESESARSKRYIPTLVGRLHAEHGNHGVTTVHPHACGEIRYFSH